MSDIVKEPTEDCLPLIHIISETTTNFNLSLLDSNTKISLYFQSINHKEWHTEIGIPLQVWQEYFPIVPIINKHNETQFYNNVPVFLNFSNSYRCTILF